MTLGKLHLKACAHIERLHLTNKPAADRVDRLMSRALNQYYKNTLPEAGLRAILAGIAVGDFTPLVNHFQITLPSSINQ